MTCHKCQTNESGNYGFCDACAKSILTAAAKRYARKANATPAVVNKKLAEDLAACERAIAALSTCEHRLGLTGSEWREAIDTATKRYTRALTDHRLLWSMYRRADKSAPYFDVNAVTPIGVAPWNGGQGPAEKPQAAMAA